MWKIPAALFPTVASYQNTFLNIQSPYASNSQLINFNPVLHTSGIAPAGKCMAASDINDIDDVSEELGDVGDTGDGVEPGCPNSFGSESNMIQWLTNFAASSSVNLSAVEVSMKDAPPYGILSMVQSFVHYLNYNGHHVAISSFNPVGEYISPTDSRPQFFSSSNGSCCEVLDQFLFNNPNHIQDTNPSAAPYPNLPYDHNDNRVSVPFVVDSLGAQVITTDSPTPLTDYLQYEGKRNFSYLQGVADSHCNPGVGQYPGCDSNGTTVYTYCAAENGTCSFAGIRTVYFGANGGYHSQTVTNSISCKLASFPPPDPQPNVPKACYYGPPLQEPQDPGVYCADGENGVCSFDGTVSVRYGANYQNMIAWPQIDSVTGHVNCNVATFGYNVSPPGVQNICAYRQWGDDPGYPDVYEGPNGYIKCAHEGQNCHFAGAARIAFGAKGNFTYRTFPVTSTESMSGAVGCNNSEFIDPEFGVVKSCYYQLAVPVVSGGSGGTGTSTCDIYATGGTPCVAAHSTVRALFSGYSGRLYQVKRPSDNTTMDIGTLSTGGYANAASQNKFCGTAGCTITIIYDQTSLHNDLAIEGPGGTVHTADSGAVANALPITVNGNIEAYGVKVTSGVGYRNNATSGVAKGKSPEGIYMVTSGTYVNGGPGSVNNGCCFDYGNAEETGNDDGAGRMDALNFGNFCGSPPCSGTGPWVESDLENGQYMGNGSNTGNKSISSNFVTAMSENNGSTRLPYMPATLRRVASPRNTQERFQPDTCP